jgi:hypothetical protein
MFGGLSVDWWGFLWTVLSIFTGAVLTWAFSPRTSREVRLILRALAQMANKDEIEFMQNDKGELVDFRIKRRLSDEASVADSVDVKENPPEQE